MSIPNVMGYGVPSDAAWAEAPVYDGDVRALPASAHPDVAATFDAAANMYFALFPDGSLELFAAGAAGIGPMISEVIQQRS